MNARLSIVTTGAAIAALIIVSLVVTDGYFRHLLILGMLFAILASNWDLTIGYAGIFNFAHVGVFAVGSYAAAISTLSFGLSPWLAFPIAVIASVAAAAAAFIPAIRLRGVYVALTTFAFTQLCLWLVLSQRDLTGGTQGMVGIPPLRVGEYSLLRDSRLGYFYAAGALLVTSTLFLRWVLRSSLGQSLVAIRDSEPYSQSRGINVARHQLAAFCLSAIFTGMVGALLAFYNGAVSPDLFGFGYQALLLSMVWFGGVGTLYGPIIGGLILTAVSVSLEPLGPWRIITVSVMIIATIRFFPRGLWGSLSGNRARRLTLGRWL